MSQTVTEPEELAARRGIYPALLLPFDEPARPDHEHAGRRYSWPDVRLPKKDLLLTVDHDDRDVVGTAFGFVKSSDGVSCQVKLGRRGEELLHLGRDGLSAEINEDTGEIFGLSLCVAGTPGFTSARIILDAVREIGFTASASLMARPVTVEWGGGSGTIIEPKLQPLPPAAPMPAMDMTRITREVVAASMSAVHAEVAQRREQWRRRQVELEEAAYLDEEQRLMAAWVPTQRWPTYLPGRQRYDAHVAQREAAERREYEARRTTQFLEYQLAAAAVTTEPPPRRSWWLRLRRRLWTDPQTTRT